MSDTSADYSKVIARAWSDESFHAQLLSDPTAALASEGIAAPEGKTFTVVEDTADTVHFVLPSRPTDLSDDDLDSVSGGFSQCWMPPPSAWPK